MDVLMASIASPLSLTRPFNASPVASGGGVRAGPRRFLLGLGASFLDQLRRMAFGIGGRSLTTSVRSQQGVSPIEQVVKNVEWPANFPFKDEDFSRFDEY